MALNDTAFIQEIIALQDDMATKTDYASAKLEYAQKLMQAVKNYIMSGDVNTTVATTGSATAQTGTGIGSIS